MKLNFSNKGQIGWNFILRLFVGMVVLAIMIYVAVKAKGGFNGILGRIAEWF